MEPLSDKIWPNCAFYDTSMKFCTHLEYIITKIFGYRAISDFALEGVGSHFKDGCLKPISSIDRLLQRRPDVVLTKTYNFCVNYFKYVTFDLLRHSNPPFVKMAAAKTNVPISHELRYLER